MKSALCFLKQIKSYIWRKVEKGFMYVYLFTEQLAGWALYHYVHNNPINLIDRTRMSAEGPPEDKYAQGHKHTDEVGITWQLNGNLWENLSGGTNRLDGDETLD